MTGLDRIFEGNPDRREFAVAMVVAHPDDESVGAGGTLASIRPDHLLVTTDGSPTDLADARAAGFCDRLQYAAARRSELAAATALVGISPERISQLTFVDQGSAFELEALTRQVFEHLNRWQPAIVLTHPYEGGHPDHDAAAFAVHTAVRMLHRAGLTGPEIVEMAFYHNWNGTMRTGTFLPVPESTVRVVELSATQQELKRQLFACYSTQQRTLQAFGCEQELFRTVPEYDFTRPPGNCRLHYEAYEWGMVGTRWCQLARQAIEALDMSETSPC